MHTVAQHRPRNYRLLQFFGLKHAILVYVDTIEHLPHELQELVFRHDTIMVFVHHAHESRHIPSRGAVACWLAAKAAVDTVLTTNDVAIRTTALRDIEGCPSA
jgi:hypothetical protein